MDKDKMPPPAVGDSDKPIVDNNPPPAADTPAAPEMKKEKAVKPPPEAHNNDTPVGEPATDTPAPNKKNKKPPLDDDGRVIADMNIKGFRWYDPHLGKQAEPPKKKEKKLLLRQAYKNGFLSLLTILTGFGLAILLIYWWLK